MEEAEALCDRVAIISKGLLRCIGTQRELKERYGQGYRLTLNFKEEGSQSIQESSESITLAVMRYL